MNPAAASAPGPEPCTAIALGANLGDPLATLTAVRPLLGQVLHHWAGADPAVAPWRLRWSPLFRTAPVGGPAGQPPYLNAVLLASGAGEPAARAGEIRCHCCWPCRAWRRPSAGSGCSPGARAASISICSGAAAISARAPPCGCPIRSTWSGPSCWPRWRPWQRSWCRREPGAGWESCWPICWLLWRMTAARRRSGWRPRPAGPSDAGPGGRG